MATVIFWQGAGYCLYWSGGGVGRKRGCHAGQQCHPLPG